MLLVCAVSQAARDEKQVTIHFEKDRSDLTAEALMAIDELVASMPGGGEHQFSVHGHTDSDGRVSYNTALSETRARAVVDHLMSKGLDPASITMKFSGELDPAASNSNDDGMAINRRVTISYVHHYFEDMSELQEELFPKEIQRFTIDPTRDEVVIGKSGTMLMFTANTLIDAKGRHVKDPVQIELTEALDLESMIAHSLSTRSGERLLETGGMLKVEAMMKEEELRLQRGKGLDIAVPTIDPKEGMELFYSDDGSDWSVAGQRMAIAPMTAQEVFEYKEEFRMRLKPQMKMSFVMPRYRPDVSNMPRKPSFYDVPRRPVEPRKESYTAVIPWYKFLSTRKLRAAAERRYDLAIADHMRKMDRYSSEMERYRADSLRVQGKVVGYEEALKKWEEAEEARYKEWYSMERAKALQDYQYRSAAERPSFDSAMTVWEREYAQRSREYWDNYQAAYTEWWNERNEKLIADVNAADETNTANMDLMSSYVFTTMQLGWINCDRFPNIPVEEMHRISVRNNSYEKKSVMLVLENINSLLQMELDNSNYFRSFNIPKNEPATLFAYMVIDGRAHICMEPIQKGRRPELRFVPSSVQEVKEKLNGFRSQRT